MDLDCEVVRDQLQNKYCRELVSEDTNQRFSLTLMGLEREQGCLLRREKVQQNYEKHVKMIISCN